MSTQHFCVVWWASDDVIITMAMDIDGHGSTPEVMMSQFSPPAGCVCAIRFSLGNPVVDFGKQGLCVWGRCWWVVVVVVGGSF